MSRRLVEFLTIILLIASCAVAAADPTWESWLTPDRPPAVAYASAVWNTARSELLVFGGLISRSDPYASPFSAPPTFGLYAFNPATATWRTVATEDTIPARYGHSAWYDRRRNVMLVFGGTDGVTRFNDLWQLDLSDDPPRWSRLAPTGTPPPARWNHSMVWDSHRDRLLVFGGNAAVLTNETYTLDLESFGWSLIPAGGTEDFAVRVEQAAAYDPRNDRLVVTAGSARSGSECVVRTVALPFGTPLWDGLAAQAPSNSRDPGSFFDEASCGFYLVDGMECFRDNTIHSLVRLDLTANGTFVGVPAGGTGPTNRLAQADAFDDEGRRYFMFGGWTVFANGPGQGTGIYRNLNDVAMLTLDPVVPWDVAAGVVTRDLLTVDVRWSVGGGTGLNAAAGPRIGIVERAVDAAPWTDFAHVRVESDSLLAFTDTTAVAGHRYGYRLRWYQCATGHWSSDAWIEIPTVGVPAVPPAALSIALAPGYANPSSGDLVLACALPGTESARVEIVDLSGRIVLRLSAAPGPRIALVPIARSQLPRSGVYFARVRQGANTARFRFIRVGGGGS